MCSAPKTDVEHSSINRLPICSNQIVFILTDIRTQRMHFSFRYYFVKLNCTRMHCSFNDTGLNLNELNSAKGPVLMEMSNLDVDIFVVYLYCTVLLPLQFFMCKLGPPVFVNFGETPVHSCEFKLKEAVMFVLIIRSFNDLHFNKVQQQAQVVDYCMSRHGELRVFKLKKYAIRAGNQASGCSTCYLSCVSA